MGSYKKYGRSLNPVVMLSFDDENTWDKETRVLLRNETVDDESDVGTVYKHLDAMVHNDAEAIRPGYLMGQPSLIENFPTNNYSMCFAPYSYDIRNDYPYAKSYLEIPHDDRIKMDKSYTFSFLMNKNSNDAQEIGKLMWDYSARKYFPNTSYWSKSVTKPIFRKGSIGCYLSMYSGYGYNYNDWSLNFYFPNNIVININQTNYSSFSSGYIYSKNIHVVVTHDYVINSKGQYYTVSRVYLNNRLFEKISDPVFGVYVAGNSAPIEIGGYAETDISYDYLNDRHITPLYIDEFGVYDRALSDVEVANLYKKAFSYDSILSNSGYIFKEYLDDYSKITNLLYGNKTTGGNYTNIRNIEGAFGKFGKMGTEFTSGSMYYNSGASLFGSSNKVTIEFFASFSGDSKGVILSSVQQYYPYKGLCVYANSNSDYAGSTPGAIEFQFQDGFSINTKLYDLAGNRVRYNDLEIRHFVITIDGNEYSVYINGVLVDTKYNNNTISGNSNTSSLTIGGSMPGDLYTDCLVQALVSYNFILSKTDIMIRCNYYKSFKIKGKVTVQGQGKRITARTYNYNDGNLIEESTSDWDGSYEINIPNDDYLNVVFLDPGDINIKPRAIGPILPDEYSDYPWDI